MELESKVTYTTGEGGEVEMIGNAQFLTQTGVDSGFAYWDDLQIKTSVPVVLNVGGDYHVSGTVKHITGDEIMRFGLTPRQPNTKVDIKLTGLQDNAWYRVQFDGVLARSDGGRAHGQTNDSGLLKFNGVHVPDG